ncbi:MAG: thioredoxin [Endomicrobiales bacterium]|nr:thioredoxin [Endomicrobiales bacterium]
MSGIELTDLNFDTEVIKSNIPVLVDFWAPWCGPCKMIAPVIEELANEYASKIKVGKVNTDNNMNTSTKYQIASIPTIIFFKGGLPVQKIVGFKPKTELKKILDGLL